MVWFYCCFFCQFLCSFCCRCFFFFFFNDTATTEIYTLSLHDALPIAPNWVLTAGHCGSMTGVAVARSEEHTSELQSLAYLVCRLLLEKKKKHKYIRCKSQTNINKITFEQNKT